MVCKSSLTNGSLNTTFLLKIFLLWFNGGACLVKWSWVVA